MNAAILQNILIFMKRVTCTGEECGAWTETYTAVQTALNETTAPQKLPEMVSL